LPRDYWRFLVRDIFNEARFSIFALGFLIGELAARHRRFGGDYRYSQ
jgi:hypothetical protein